MSAAGAGPDSVASLLVEGELSIEGRLMAASNATLYARVSAGGAESACVIKPVSGERPLWDFPDGTLAGREIAAYAMSELLGWGLVPLTVWRPESPVGPAMVQTWIDASPSQTAVDVVRPQDVPEQWFPVLQAQDESGAPLVLVHDSHPDLRRLAVFDAIVNNADRKGGHVLVDEAGRLWGIDHGVTFAADDKLRTVLWGWAGQALPDDVVRDVARLGEELGSDVDVIDRWLAHDERAALRRRVAHLLEEGRFPVPTGDWPAIPWPVL